MCQSPVVVTHCEQEIDPLMMKKLHFCIPRSVLGTRGLIHTPRVKFFINTKEKCKLKSFMYIRVGTGTYKSVLFILYFLIEKLNFTLPAVRNAWIASPNFHNRIIIVNNFRNCTIKQTSSDD